MNICKPSGKHDVRQVSVSVKLVSITLNLPGHTLQLPLPVFLSKTLIVLNYEFILLLLAF